MLLFVKFDNLKVGYLVVMGLFVVFGVIWFYICYCNCKECIVILEVLKEKLIFLFVVKIFIMNKLLLIFVLMMIFLIFVYNIKFVMLVYFV